MPNRTPSQYLIQTSTQHHGITVMFSPDILQHEIFSADQIIGQTYCTFISMISGLRINHAMADVSHNFSGIWKPCKRQIIYHMISDDESL